MLELNKIYCADSLQYLKLIDNNSIDLVLTDPPYGITACDWDTVPDLEKLWRELKRIGKDKTAYVFTASQPFTTDLINSNRKWFKYEWIWVKNQTGSFIHAKNRPMCYHENIIVFYDSVPAYNPQFDEYSFSTKLRFKNGEKVSNKNQKIKSSNNTFNLERGTDHTIEIERGKYPSSIRHIDSVHNQSGDRFHPTQKPVKLMQYLIKTYSNPNDTILDPFLGSGTTALACLMENRNFIGIEREQKYCDIAEKRIDNYKRQGKLDL